MKHESYCGLVIISFWVNYSFTEPPDQLQYCIFSPTFIIIGRQTSAAVKHSCTSKDPSAPHMLYLQLLSWTTTPDNVVKWLKLCTGSPPFLYNYPIKLALMSPLSFCPEASPHSVCKVRVPSLPQFDSVKAWKQIKGCCFSQSWADTEPVRTRLTRGSFATCCFCLWWGLRNVGTSLHSCFFFPPLFFSLSLQWMILYEGPAGTWGSGAQNCVLVAFLLLGIKMFTAKQSV